MTLLASPGDLPTLRPITRHLLKSANFDFSEVVLVIDTLPPHPAQMIERLSTTAAEMLASGEITRIDRLSDLRPSSDQFVEIPSHLRDHRGIPVMGWIAGIDATNGDYVCHFDSDILIFTAKIFLGSKRLLSLWKLIR
jgi:hypothetical protein